MTTEYQFPVQLFRENFENKAIRPDAIPQHLARLTIETAKNDHWSAYLRRQKLRYQLKTLKILKQAVARKDPLTIQRWYLPGLFDEIGFFVGVELDILESVAPKNASMGINPLLNLQRGIQR